MFKIGLDLDSTLVNWINNPEKIAANKLKMKIPKRYDYFYNDISSKLRKEIYKLFEDPWFMSKENLKYDIKDKLALENWKNNGHNLFIITSRYKSKEMIKVTKEIVEDWFPKIDDLLICKKPEEKIGCFKNLMLDVWIDDFFDIILKADSLGILTFLINKHYNKNFIFNNLHRVNSVYEIYERGFIK